MTKAGSVAVPLSRHHCRATAWWLSKRLLPFALEAWRSTRSEANANALVMASRLARQFDGFARRRLKDDDQDRDADRTLTRSDAAWLAAFIIDRNPRNLADLDSSSNGLPSVIPWTGDLPTNEQLAAMPLLAAQTILFGLGTDETMRRCHDRVYSRKTGPKRQSLTLDDVANRHVGNPIEGGDERYERRLRKRAREDEIAAEIAEEWQRAMRALAGRRSDDTEISDNRYPPAIDETR